MYIRLRDLREERRMTQIELAIKIGVSQETISLYERGKHLPSTGHLIKLSSIFGVSIDYLLCLSPTRFAVEQVSLTDEEAKLISVYNTLSQSGKALFNSYLQGLCDFRQQK